MNKLDDYKNYASETAYFEGAEGMGNEVSMLYLVGALLLKHVVRKKTGAKSFGGLGASLGVHIRHELPTVSIFDVCCGPGNVPNYLSLILPDAKVSGLDSSDIFVAAANERFQALDWQFVCGDARDFQLHKKFDFITGSSAYHHIEDESKIDFLKHLALHLEVDGRILLCDNFLPLYQSDNERVEAVNQYYGLLKTYYRNGGGNSAAIAAISGSHERDLIKANEFKVSYSMFLDHVSAAGLCVEEKIAVWQPPELASMSAGSYVISLKKI